MGGTRITADHEAWQPVGGEEQWSDSFYFGGGDGHGLAFYARVGRRPNETVTEGALGVWLPGQGFLLSFARTPPGQAVAAGPLSFECLLPLVVWEVRFEGEGRLFERAEHVATDRDAYRTVPASVALRFAAWGEPLSFESGLAEGVATDHYEQSGSVAGTLIVDGRRHPLAGRGMRDHSWGVRDWQQVPYWRWFGMVADPDNFIVLNNVGLRDGGETAGGFMMREGEIAAIVACETDSELDPELGVQRSFAAHATDAMGRETTLTGRALEVAPLRQRRDGRLTHVNEALTDYEWEGRRGTGISEYLVQIPAAGSVPR
ncbi:MAG: DUF7064 domain-containing protein [Solirubrobacterales bacterium]